MNSPFDNPALPPPEAPKELTGHTVMDALLPAPALPLLLLLLVVLPVGLLAAYSLLVPLAESVTSLFFKGTDALYATLPWFYYVKLAAFLLLGFFGVFQLLVRVQAYYYTIWAKRFPRPHPLHVDYQPDGQSSLMALLGWTVYRSVSLLGPPVLLGLLTAGLGVLEVYLLNMFSGLPFLSLPIQFIVAIFLFMLMCLFTGFACVNSLWAYFTTIFGDIVAVTEPELPSKTIYERCGRIAFASPLVYLYYPAHFLFVTGVLILLYLFLSTYTIKDLLTLQINIPLVLGLEVLVLGVFLILNFMKFYTYHSALANFYQKLPLEVKDRQGY
jgi:hypothetical protein